MIAVGILSFTLGFIFLYIYLTRIRTDKGGRKLRTAESLRALQQQKRDQSTDTPSIMQVQPGGVIHLEGVGLKSESFDAQIRARHLHKRGSDRWVELEADRGDRTVYLSLEEDDELSVAVTLEQPSLKDLGLSGERINNLDNQPESTISYKGTTYSLSEKGNALFCRDQDELRPEPYTYWELESHKGDEYLTLVRWQDGSLEVNVSVRVDPSLITVYSIS